MAVRKTKPITIPAIYKGDTFGNWSMPSTYRHYIYEVLRNNSFQNVKRQLNLSAIEMREILKGLNIPIPQPYSIDAGPALNPLSHPSEHPLVSWTRHVLLRKGVQDTRKILCCTRGTYLDIRVSKKPLERALFIFNNLINIIEQRGWVVSIGLDDRPAWTHAIVNRQRIPLSISERVVELGTKPKSMVTPYHKKFSDDFPPSFRRRAIRDCAQTGELTIAFFKKCWTDSPKRPLEKRFNEISDYLLEVETMTELNLKYKKDEKWLEWHVESWSKATQMRNFINIIRKEIIASGQTDAEIDSLKDWCIWASSYADSLDPFVIGTDNIPRKITPVRNVETVIVESMPGWAWAQLKRAQ